MDINILNQINSLNSLAYPDILIRGRDQDRVWERFYVIGEDLRTVRLVPFRNIIGCFYLPGVHDNLLH